MGCVVNPIVKGAPGHISAHVVELNNVIWSHMFDRIKSNLEWKLLSFPVIENAEEAKTWEEEDSDGHDSSSSSHRAPEQDHQSGGEWNKHLFSLDCFPMQQDARLEAPACQEDDNCAS